ncbi:MAG TPA: aldo/keto reductase [Candidatus Hydrogenedentes bacterium]|jgi:L-glyceraldehyde 3-phosphate reductase|nr:aldo/keto reductase [Candidatus Hydrogenedentota bacterium]MDY0030813.1 aldo/keto reductase [FCB group bacterium]NLT60744.1 L-glyceraldehyde 3-phosphate reductase [Candidatus Hydrogenedentota bacterium]HNZ19808.1 aldo/keto reductase [Candidatus Hydrogenedentota bacterium]HOH35703.1 aldo/keto reductase [Candidatus Hydrogenedentota bacterium]
MTFDSRRYEKLDYRRCGNSGLLLPPVSLGMWHNFGTRADHDACRAMMRTAFDLGVTHFDLANNYGPEPGSAEERTGRILREDFAGHRDELIISTKAGYRMWPGPYGEWGSKKYLVASLDQSLKRLGLEYVDIFYSHRPDPLTPLEETLGALDLIVKQGKALYAGVSSYRGAFFVQAVETVRRHDWAPITIHQPCYNMMHRWIESDLLEYTAQYGAGVIVFSPLAQGLLTNKYLDPANPVPEASRAADPDGFLRREAVTEEVVSRVRQLAELANARGQSVAQLAIAWVLRDPRVTSALIGARTPEQVKDCVGALDNLVFTDEELATIDRLFPAD